jgi:hypothetical protein
MPEQIGYAVCLDNEGYEASLELRKLYPVVTPEANDPAGYIRIIDESGEDYLYVASAFETIPLPPHIARRLATTYS